MGPLASPFRVCGLPWVVSRFFQTCSKVISVGHLSPDSSYKFPYRGVGKDYSLSPWILEISLVLDQNSHLNSSFSRRLTVFREDLMASGRPLKMPAQPEDLRSPVEAAGAKLGGTSSARG